MISTELIQEVARQEARRAAARGRWANVDVDDLRQEAVCVILRCVHSYDPARGVPFTAYVRRPVRLALAKFCARQSSPVSASDNYTDRLVTLDRASDAELSGAVDHNVRPDRYAALSQWRRMLVVAVRDAVVGLPLAGLAQEVMLDGVSPGQVARREGAEVNRLYLTLETARRRLRSNEAVKQMRDHLRGTQ